MPGLAFGAVDGDVLAAEAHGHVVGVDLLVNYVGLVGLFDEAAGELQCDVPAAAARSPRP